MNAPIKASNGQGWARAAVAVGAVLSIAGNATETVLTTSPVSLAIRITIAIFLPVIVFIAVEVFVRVAWRRTTLDFIGRAMLITLPSFGAAYVSFGHLFSLSRLSGADEIAASANALAIDGLMVGGTVALLAIRAARLAEIEPEPATAAPALSAAEVSAIAVEPVLSETERLTQHATLAEIGNTDLTPREPLVQKKLSRLRPVAEDKQEAIRLLLAGTSVADVCEKLNMSRATVGKYNTQINKQRAAGPDTDVPPIAGVGIDLMLIIRDGIRRERVR